MLYSVPFAGLDEDGFPTFYNEKGETVKNINLQNREDVDFLKYEGSADPTTFGSLGNIFNYRNFRLNIYVTYSFGNKLRLDQVFNRYYTDKEEKCCWFAPIIIFTW